ncbi:MAG: glycosyltransferase, partial [Bacteroidales bacterium]
FARQGHEVTVIFPTHGRDYSEFQKEFNVKIKDLGKLKFRSIKLKGKGLELLIRRALRRIMQLLFEYPDIELMFKLARALKNEKEYDLLISIAVPYPIHWGVAKAWNKQQNIAKTWIADCGDPYMGCKTDSFRKMFYFRYVERWFMRKANYITIPAESARNGYYPEFQKKIRVIPQGFQFPEKIVYDSNIKNKVPAFCYAGNFIPELRDPREFLRFLVRLNADFKFYIFTHTKDLVEPFKQQLDGKLIINDIIPREQLLDILSTMDFLVNFDNNTSVQIPSKLIDYAIAGRPILNITNEPDSETIMEFLQGNYRNAIKIDNIDQYRIENVCASFLALSEKNEG